MRGHNIDERIEHLLKQKMPLVRLAELLGASRFISYSRNRKVTRLDVGAFRNFLEESEGVSLPENYSFTGDIILPPDKLERTLVGNGKGIDPKSIVTRAQYVAELLGTLQWFSYDLYDGKNTDVMMRKESYVGFVIRNSEDMAFKKLVLVCDEEGNATFIVHHMEHDVDAYLNMKKSEIKTLINDQKANRVVWNFKDAEEYKAVIKALLLNGWMEQEVFLVSSSSHEGKMSVSEGNQQKGLKISDIPLLAKEYSLKNILPVNQVLAGTGKKLWWKCSDPECGYEWEAFGYSRSGKKSAGCPACAGLVATEKNNLAVTHSDLAREYLSRNILPVNQVLAGTHKKLWWKCSDKDCGHEWQASGHDRSGNDKTGCPACAGQVVTEKNNLTMTHPDLAREYSSKNILPANQVLASTNKKLWWRCLDSECGHEWEVSGNSRVHGGCGKGTGCPACAGLVATEKNNLAVTHPELIREYSSRNILPADKVIARTGKKLWWKCSKKGCGHEWPAAGNERIRGTSCPVCAAERRAESNRNRGKRRKKVQ